MPGLAGSAVTVRWSGSVDIVTLCARNCTFGLLLSALWHVGLHANSSASAFQPYPVTGESGIDPNVGRYFGNTLSEDECKDQS